MSIAQTFGGLDDGLQLLDGFLAVGLLLFLLAAGDQVDKAHDQPDDGLEDDHHAAHGVGVAQRERIGGLLGRDLRDGLAEDDDQHREDHGGGPGVLVAAQQQDDEHGAERGSRDIGQVVADEDGRERVVEALGDLHRRPGAFRAVVAQVLQAHGVARGIGHLRRRAEGGKAQAHEDARRDRKDRRHASSPPSSFSGRSSTFSFRMRLCSISSTVTDTPW